MAKIPKAWGRLGRSLKRTGAQYGRNGAYIASRVAKGGPAAAWSTLRKSSTMKWAATGSIAGGIYGAIDPNQSMVGGAMRGGALGAGLNAGRRTYRNFRRFK